MWKRQIKAEVTVPAQLGDIELTPWTKLGVGEISVCSSRTWLGNKGQSLLLVEASALKNLNSHTALHAAGWPDFAGKRQRERERERKKGS